MELDRAGVVELDSSTPAKWSRHLVVRLPGHAFADNGHMGRFVEALLDAPEVTRPPVSGGFRVYRVGFTTVRVLVEALLDAPEVTSHDHASLGFRV